MITNIRIMSVVVTKHPTDFKRIRKHYKQLYIYKFHNVDEVEKSFKSKLTRLIQEERT